MSKWRKIETAPMDGTRVRLGHKDDSSSMKENGICPTFGSFNGQGWDMSSWFIIPGGRHGIMSKHPTHWMPLSTPKQEKRSDGS